MKKFLFFALTALAVLLFVTTNVTPSSADTLDSSNSAMEEINPYDFINSKGEVIKYSGIQKKRKSPQN